MLIGITGTDGAGKGAVVAYLIAQKGFAHYSARAIWEEEFKKRGIESTRANMRLIANELRAVHGNDFLIKYYLQKMGNTSEIDAIIESIRTVAEVETLKKEGGILLAVDAETKTRYKRIKGRKSTSDKVSFEEFVAHEQLEMNDPDPSGMQKSKVMTMADYTIKNNGTMFELKTKIKTFLDEVNYD